MKNKFSPSFEKFASVRPHKFYVYLLPTIPIASDGARRSIQKERWVCCYRQKSQLHSLIRESYIHADFAASEEISERAFSTRPGMPISRDNSALQRALHFFVKLFAN